MFMTDPFNKPGLKENTVAASEARLRALVTATSDIIYSLSADWSVMRELDGRGFLKDTKEPTTDWQSKNVHPEDLERVKAAIDTAIRGKKIFQMEHRVLRIDDSTGWTFSRAVPILDNEGEIIEWFGTASDITDRKLAEEALQESIAHSEKQRRLYETITSGTPDLMYVFDLNYRFTYANSALLSMWGKTWENAIGKDLLENGYEPWHAEMHEREIDQVKATKQPIRGEVSFPHATLGRRMYDYIFTPVFDENGEVEAVSGTTRDVTERKQFEQALAHSAEELQALNEEMVVINEEQAASNEELITANEQLAHVNQQLLAAHQKIEDGEVALRLAIESGELATWSLDERLGNITASARFNELFGLNPEDHVPYDAAVSQILPEYRQMVQDAVTASFNSGARFNVEYPITSLRDGKLRWIRSVGKLVTDEKSGNYITGVIADITEQKMDEIRKNDFIGMVSHELKTPLTSMKGYIQILLNKLKEREDDFTISALEKANAQVAKMTGMINGFLNISRLESGKIHINLQVFDLAQLIKEAEEETLATIGSHTIIFEPVETTFIHADRDKIGQVIHNLISNAVKYSPAGSLINVACIKINGLAKLSVQDQGMGIKADDLPNIFNRYYRVEDHHMFSISGFGIGLYLCSEIVHRHHGEIRAESEFGKGSIFSFSLPLAAHVIA